MDGRDSQCPGTRWPQAGGVRAGHGGGDYRGPHAGAVHGTTKGDVSVTVDKEGAAARCQPSRRRQDDLQRRRPGSDPGTQGRRRRVHRQHDVRDSAHDGIVHRCSDSGRSDRRGRLLLGRGPWRGRSGLPGGHEGDGEPHRPVARAEGVHCTDRAAYRRHDQRRDREDAGRRGSDVRQGRQEVRQGHGQCHQATGLGQGRGQRSEDRGHPSYQGGQRGVRGISARGCGHWRRDHARRQDRDRRPWPDVQGRRRRLYGGLRPDRGRRDRPDSRRGGRAVRSAATGHQADEEDQDRLRSGQGQGERRAGPTDPLRGRPGDDGARDRHWWAGLHADRAASCRGRHDRRRDGREAGGRWLQARRPGSSGPAGGGRRGNQDQARCTVRREDRTGEARGSR